MEGHGDARTGVVVHARLEAPMEQHRKPRRMTKWVAAGMPLAGYALVFGVRSAAAGGVWLSGPGAFFSPVSTGGAGPGLLHWRRGPPGLAGSLLGYALPTLPP